MRSVLSFATVAGLALAGVSAYAQPIISAKSGVVAGVEGTALIDNQEIQSSATHFPEVKEGSVLSTQDGRVELMLPPGFMLRLGENGSVKMLSNRLMDTRVDLQAGSAVVEVDQTKEDYTVAVAMKNDVVNLAKVGVYRFDSNPPQLKVFHGSATVQVADTTVMVGSGRMLTLDGATTTQKFDAEQTDALDNWSRRRAESMALANVSGAQYAHQSYAQPTSNGWVYNPYFDMYTYLPMMGSMCNPYYGACFYSPMMAYNLFYLQPMMGYGMPGVAGLRNTSIGGGTALNSGRSIGTLTAPSGSALGSRAGTYSGGSASSGGSGISGGGGGIGSGGSSGISGGGHAGGGAVGGGGHGK